MATELEQELQRKIGYMRDQLRQIEATLDATPGAIRVREGRAHEDLAASVAVTLAKFRDLFLKNA